MFILRGEVKGQGHRRAEKGDSLSGTDTKTGVLLLEQQENFFKVLQWSSFRNAHFLAQRSH